MKSSRCSLVVGERVVARCEDGLLEVEYAIFDPDEVIVTAALGFGAREQGYLTTAGLARDRLRAARLDAGLAQRAFEALRLTHLRALARSPLVLEVIDQLTPYEAFEGGEFSAATHTYTGAWLDLTALAQACRLNGAAHLVQALHLLLVVEEVPDDVPVRLLTSEVTAERRPGARTWSKVRFEGAARLPNVLASMGAPQMAPPALTLEEDVALREDLLRNLRARAVASPTSRERLRALASRLSRVPRTPAYGISIPAMVPPAPASDTAVAALRSTPMPNMPQVVPGAPPSPDSIMLFEELRRQTELLRGDGHLRDVAKFLSAMADRSARIPELAILAARAWLAAGETGHARHLAKELIASTETPESDRIVALEILKATSPTNESAAPPPITHITPSPIIVLDTAEDRSAPEGASMPPYTAESVEIEIPISARVPEFADAPNTERMADAPPPPQTARIPRPSPVSVRAPPISAAAPILAAPFAAPPPSPPPPAPPAAPAIPAVPVTPAPAAPPAAPLMAPPAAPLVAPQRPLEPPRAEIVETLSLPEGAREEMLPEGVTPRTPLQGRIAMTRLSRLIGRDYRIWYGTALKTNAIAIETMQRHLRRRFGDVRADEKRIKQLEIELTRHGALLSEILARTLGAEWVDLSGQKPGHWSMMLPGNIRVWPIGRVYRFFRQGHREADLVAFYLELEDKVRRGGE